MNPRRSQTNAKAGWARCGAIAFLAAACLAGRGAIASEVDELALDQVSVRELMRLETAQALKRLRAERNEPAAGYAGQPAVGPARGTMSGASLVAIYGVGRKLMAEVRLDGRTLLFMRGRPQAVGPGKAHPLRLVEITDRCVEIALGEQQRSLCAAASPSSEG